MSEHALAAGIILKLRYEIQSVIGFGGMAYVYSAYDRRTEDEVSIKELFPAACCYRKQNGKDVTAYSQNALVQYEDCRNSFKREAELMSYFTPCPNLMGVRDFFEENGTCYYVMERLYGGTLADWLHQHRNPMQEEDAKRIALEVLNALSFLHKRGIVHRDVGCSNIYITDSGKVKLFDYGAAIAKDRPRSLSVVMNSKYAPPEQYRSGHVIGPWTDIYALGAVLYKAVTGKYVMDAMERMINDELAPPIQLNGQISKGFSNAIMKALELDYKERFQTAEKFRDCLKSGGLQAWRSKKEKERLVRNQIKKYLLIILGILLAVVGCVWLILQ